ncbi:hypothetical protein TARUN_7427 [Trichoderma arundinaceum]|uniref:Uncharacterized protein n=1 Tax=Trichoderma arundinaceum TaxID=490622 RepID=A0A395NGA5_TRIAR|nr:hypothetical protein TARUN_7427 [Trichoderma arundinaceum]
MAAMNKFTTCTFVLKKCDFSSPQIAPTCVKSWCQGEPYGFGSCTTDFTGVPAECCSQSTVGDVAQCMANFQKQQGYGIFGDACLAVERYVTNCQNADSDFRSEPLKKQADCLCYDDKNNYDPDKWDNAVATCVSTGESAHPTIWSALQRNSEVIGMCTKFAGAAATTGPVPTDSASLTATGDASPGTTAVDTATPTETGSTVARTTGSGEQTSPPSTATRSSAAATTTSSSAATRPGEMNYAQMKWAAVGLGVVLPAFIMTL